MKERPILFSGEMVRAILEGRKTQTRRIIKPQPTNDTCFAWFAPDVIPECNRAEEGLWSEAPKDFIQPSPYGRPGDRLWVCRPDPAEGWRDGIEFRADELDLEDGDVLPLYQPEAPVDFYADYSKSGWRPSIHMPRWASRLTLEVTEVRVERLQDISLEDIGSEGVTLPPEFVGMAGGYPIEHPDADKDPWYFWAELWDSINADRGFGWDSNPWVWAVSFELMEENNG